MQEKSGVRYVLVFGRWGELAQVRADVEIDGALTSVSVYLEDRHALSFQGALPLELVSSPLAFLIALSNMIETALNAVVERKLAEDVDRVKEAFQKENPQGWTTFQENSAKIREAIERRRAESGKEAEEKASEARSIGAIKARLKAAALKVSGRSNEEIKGIAEEACESLKGEGYTREEIFTALIEAVKEWEREANSN